MYQLTKDPNVIRRVADGAWIPAAPGNVDYDEYLRWLADGNTPTPVESQHAD